MSQKFCNILVTWCTIQEFRMFLPRLCRWLTRCQAHLILSPSATQWICLSSLNHDLRIHSFRPSCLGLIIKVFARQAKFLPPSDDCTLNDCAFTFYLSVFGCIYDIIAEFRLLKHEFHIHLCIFTCAAFKSQMEWSNAQCVSTPTTNRCRYQNIAKLLTHPSNI